MSVVNGIETQDPPGRKSGENTGFQTRWRLVGEKPATAIPGCQTRIRKCSDEKRPVGAWATVLFGCCGEPTTPRLNKSLGVRQWERRRGEFCRIQPKVRAPKRQQIRYRDRICKTRRINIQVFSSVFSQRGDKEGRFEIHAFGLGAFG